MWNEPGAMISVEARWMSGFISTSIAIASIVWMNITSQNGLFEMNAL